MIWLWLKYSVVLVAELVIIYSFCSVLREANVLCRLHHPNIVKVFGRTVWPNAVGIVMEYIDGGNLEDLLVEGDHSKPSWICLFHIAKGIVHALSYIHSYKKCKSLCHGDLKPQNVLLTKQFQVKLSDFGSVTLLHATGASATTLDTAPSNQHTLQYAAPEFLKDTNQDRKPAMDMYRYVYCQHVSSNCIVCKLFYTRF